MKLAINIAAAIIVILLFSLLVQKKPAGTTSTLEAEQASLQAIIDDTNGIDAISKKLRAESETGKLLADYIVLAQRFLEAPEMDFPKETPDDIIPNYLALKMLSALSNKGSKKTLRAYLIKLHKLNKNTGWFNEDDFLINTAEYIVKRSEQRDYWWRAHIVKNLRYISLYDKGMHDQYFRWLDASNGWVKKRETLYWQGKLGLNICENTIHQYNCVSKLMFEFTTLSLKSREHALMKLLCNVIILRSGEAIKINWCEQKFSQINLHVKTVS